LAYRCFVSIPAALQFPLSRVTLSIATDGVNRKNVDISISPPTPVTTMGATHLTQHLGIWETMCSSIFNRIRIATVPSKYMRASAALSMRRCITPRLWGIANESSGSYTSGSSVYWKAQSLIATLFIVESGAAFGGSGFMNLYSSAYDEPFDYYYYDYMDGQYDDHITGRSSGSSSYGSLYDLTTP
jgi:hypothetical protein